MIKKITKPFLILIAILLLVLSLSACSEADHVNANLGKQADYFECERRITVYNAHTDKVILNIEGYMSISNDTEDELVVTCKVGPNEYKKNYVYINRFNTLYVVEDITGAHTDPYHYKLYFHDDLLPTVEWRP